MTFLNAQQFAFILGIKKQDARAKMCFAHCSSKNETCKAFFDEDGKLQGHEQYPEALAISLLSERCNLPDLQTAVNDIKDNYLTRPASKKFILCDYPEKQIERMAENGEKKRIRIPAALKSMLPLSTVRTIDDEWRKRFPKYNS